MNRTNNKHGPGRYWLTGSGMREGPDEDSSGNPRDGTTARPRDGTLAIRDGTLRRPRDGTRHTAGREAKGPPGTVKYSETRYSQAFHLREMLWGDRPIGAGQGEVRPGSTCIRYRKSDNECRISKLPAFGNRSFGFGLEVVIEHWTFNIHDQNS